MASVPLVSHYAAARHPPRLFCGVQKSLLALLVPEGLIVLVAAALLRWDALLAPLAAFLPAYPWVALGGAVLLALRFGRGNVLFALAALVLADRAVAWGGASPVALRSAAVLLPLNLVALGLLPERGVVSAAAARRLAALIVQAAFVVVLARPEERATAALLDARFLPTGLGGGASVGDLAVLLFAAAAIVFAAHIVWRPGPQTRGFLWALVAGFLALVAGPAPVAPGLSAATFLFGTAALVLLAAVVEASHALAFRDALTGLPGRRAFDDALKRIDGPCAVAMVDVDRFKTVNDRHGHDVGDQVLRMVAGVLEHVGPGGRAYRYGGEEFAVLFPGRSAAECVPALEARRGAVEAATFTVRAADRPRKRPKHPAPRAAQERLAVTVSVGVADRVARDIPLELVVQAADEALYRAKRRGRNRVVAAAGPVVRPGQEAGASRPP
jgi:diguanylate cyclase (GGDEF)-like protein